LTCNLVAKRQEEEEMQTVLDIAEHSCLPKELLCELDKIITPYYNANVHTEKGEKCGHPSLTVARTSEVPQKYLKI
jgi:hypothetical protein